MANSQQDGRGQVEIFTRNNFKGERKSPKAWGEIRTILSADDSGRVWCFPDSDTVRSFDGVSGWVDRLAGLGNAVVPQIPELIGRMIIEADRR